MWRKAVCYGLAGLLVSVTPASADPGARGAAAPAKASRSSGSKRALWTIVGIGAGFGAGMLIGLSAFDDSINSDQKVWTSALVGAAAGGLAGNLLGKSIGGAAAVPATRVSRPSVDVPTMAWPAVATTPDDTLRRRVRAVNALPTPAP